MCCPVRMKIKPSPACSLGNILIINCTTNVPQMYHKCTTNVPQIGYASLVLVLEAKIVTNHAIIYPK